MKNNTNNRYWEKIFNLFIFAAVVILPPYFADDWDWLGLTFIVGLFVLGYLDS